MDKNILLVTPPFTQLNTPYPATAYLKGFLNTKNINSVQVDLGLEVILEIFSANGLTKIFEFSTEHNLINSENSQRIFALREHYIRNINDIIRFLQGENQTFARHICINNFLPQASRFEQLEHQIQVFGLMGIQDNAKHRATLFLEDISDFIIDCVDANFGFSKYAEQLGSSANVFDDLYEQLEGQTSYIDSVYLDVFNKKIVANEPDMVCFSVPFPGNLYSAFRCARFLKNNYPKIKITLGGGFPNTELRSLAEPRVFDYVDFITLDDGELPLELLINNVFDSIGIGDLDLKRTYYRQDGNVLFNNSSLKKDYLQSELGCPDYSDLLIDKYISVIEIANPMHSLWSDGRWNKLTMAHGCYWAKCAFCDVSLDYIKNYDPVDVKLLVDRVEALMLQTGENGFHFVDEAAPPALMKAFALEIIRRKLVITWWTNIRFEKKFSKDFCVLLKASGCIAVSGGLEVASDRLLKLINKGVTVEQVAKVTKNLTDAGIMVHAYLMYGFPMQTMQEVVNSLEMVRQLFELGIVQSAFWHRFALTAHSPVGLNPSKFNIEPIINNIEFANNDVQYTDKTGIDYSIFGFGLKKSSYNFMHGIGFNIPVHKWFENDNSEIAIPKTTISKQFVEDAVNSENEVFTKLSSTIVWLGGTPTVTYSSKRRKGNLFELVMLKFHGLENNIVVTLDRDKGVWFLKMLETIDVNANNDITLSQLKNDFEDSFDSFELFWYSKPIVTLKNHDLLSL